LGKATGELDVADWRGDAANVGGGCAHSLGLGPGGRIVAWGDNTDGQCNIPAPNSGFIAIAAGRYHSLGLRSSSVTGVEKLPVPGEMPGTMSRLIVMPSCDPWRVRPWGPLPR